ncbi:2-oxo-4-hydroxy-4-carboxy-5-ureidoimidazoline decarboxylase [Luteitalea sp.]
MLTIAQVNQLDRNEFVDAVGWVFEHSPWVAARTWDARPFADGAALHAAMTQQVRAASQDEQLALVRAHPDLGARTRMSAASMGEQAGAGLDQLSPDEHHRLQTANERYRHTFGFPFLFAVRGSTPREVLAALESRLASTPAEEFETALLQVFRIAAFRLEGVVAP